MLKFTLGAKDTEDLYYFSPRHYECFSNRMFLPLRGYPIEDIHVADLDLSQWIAPPYKEIYKNSHFVWDKEIVVLFNKYNSEWNGPPITFLDKEILGELIFSLENRFQVVYVRPTAKEILDDTSMNYDLNEYAYIREKFPNTILIQDLHRRYPELTYNALQMRLFSNCDSFVSVQGGAAILCSYFGGTNVIYARKGPTRSRTAAELEVDAYNRWYHEFSGCRIVHADDYESLLRSVEEQFLLP
jgi:hypothetical protein